MTLHVTAFYAAILTILVLVLATIVSSRRGSTGISILDGGDATLALWMRRHGNLVENAPLALILMGLAESNGLSATWLHAMGVALVVTRLVHIVGLDATNPRAPLRIVGGVGTHLAMLGAAGYLLATTL